MVLIDRKWTAVILRAQAGAHSLGHPPDVECPGPGGFRMRTKPQRSRCCARCSAVIFAINSEDGWNRLRPLNVRANSSVWVTSSRVAGFNFEGSSSMPAGYTP